MNLTDFLPFVEPDKFAIIQVEREDEHAPVIYADNLKNKSLTGSVNFNASFLNYSFGSAAVNTSHASNGVTKNLAVDNTSFICHRETPINAREMVYK